MPEFTAKFLAHIKRDKPDHFPTEVYNVGTYSVDNPQQLKQIINQELGAIIQNGGMIVSLDPAGIIDSNKVNIDDRVYVPMHMISYIEAIVRPMSPMPIPVKTGVLDANKKEIIEYETPEGFKILPS